ncbi:MAG: metallophosphoesterase family protein [Promethearchaeota archaeon]
MNIIVHGNSHAPEIKEESGLLLLNPGSPTHPRSPKSHKMYKKRRPLPSVIILDIEHEFSSSYIVNFKL